ncbi:alkaline phosphatase D family protein [Streptomyces fuscigenes]|uniref:alkaline phosphatase D family protein n=1 Tax=Streptomyces fuscigenes TaxID=1528880 RepID=UPI001F33CD39|nr:alkaline phosphatase D family protein [Streptomyces fuscigenes]MCF3960905.1 alkaline phosphatase family protein [Streptomyces fuscigenes]
MTELRLGPVLRHVAWDGSGTATVWVEAGAAATAEVRCADGASGSAPTFEVAGHHYALVQVDGLTPGTSTPYEVRLDGERVWPREDGGFPPSTIRTPAHGGGSAQGAGSTEGAGGGSRARVAFGSCRWARPARDGHDPIGPDALDTLALRLARADESERPDVLLLVGDQVYADETSPGTQEWLAARRDLSKPPGTQVADYEEYSHLYDESWGDPEVRWLLSTVPSCMVFDDHDVIDDWNTSAAWLAEMRRTDWWDERVVSGLMSYWVYQHLGNLAPADLERDELYAAVRASGDATTLVRDFARRADRDPESTRWSYRRDFGRTRLLVIDSRGSRVLAEDRRAMIDEQEARWVREQALDAPGTCDHLLLGTSLPWLMPPMIHDLESWDSVLCDGGRGERWKRLGEKLRRAADLEHWPAFPRSFDELTALIAEVGSGESAPATVCVLSGDVHHAYVAEAAWPADRAGAAVTSRVAQLTCSPVHNSVPGYMKITFRLGWNGIGKVVGRALRLHGRLRRPPVAWERTGGPWFGNQLMTLTLDGRRADLRLDQSRADADGTARLVTVDERTLTHDA